VRRVATGVSIIALTIAAAQPALGDPERVTASQRAAPQPQSEIKHRPEEQQVLLRADQIINDQDLATVTASGHVEIDQGGRILLADAVSYNVKQDVIVASGNVSLTDIDGQVNFADYIELSGDMKQAIERHMHVLMVDDSRFAAATARRVGGDRDILDNVIYTPCRPCADNPDRAPLWDIRARQVVDDEVAHKMTYSDAWFDVAGVPILYTPYLSTADPEVKRETGLLPPTFVSNRIVGSGIRTPYFLILSPYQDLTLDPIFTTNEGAGLGATWRARTEVGQLTTSGSIANEPKVANINKTTVGWDVDAHSQFAIDETWRAGYDVQQASDRDYLRYYNYPLPQPYLTQHPYVEGFGGRDYAAVEAYSFQNQSDLTYLLPPGVSSKSPSVLPQLTYSAQTSPGWQGGYWSFDTRGASIWRPSDETESRRVNTLTSWHLPHISSDGEVFNFTASMRLDGYNSNNVTGLGEGAVNAYRTVPQASVDWRLPLSKIGEHSNQTFTPIVMVNVGPYGGNSEKIPNEDSLDFELDDSNIFSPAPSTGYDRIAPGPRVAYGAEYTINNRDQTAADVLLAQSYEPRTQNVFQPGTGLDHNFSDFVGRFNVSPSSNLGVTYQFRINEQDYSFRHSEVDLNVGPRPLHLTLGYIFLDELNTTTNLTFVDQVTADLKAQVTRNVGVEFYDTQNIGPRAGPLQVGGRVRYEDECTAVELDGGVRYTTVNTILTGHYVILRLTLKTVTQFPVNLF
jgi:LPS-assembly protein